MSENTVITCVYCGHEYPHGTPTAKHEILTEHIKTCDQHPMRESERKVTVLRSALEGLLGVSTKKELDVMELVIRSTPGADSDRALAINAIDALRSCCD